MASPLPPPTHQPDNHTNRLARESSPYLLQHAHNPVDWYSWGTEAFEAARKRDVPIFLSIGYSTCYWCHVMERESFENAEIAGQMNDHFICIKVDREERPDVDDVYMAAVQAMTHSGGWPMSVFLEPKSLKPFWCGTYFPPKDAYGRPGFPNVLTGLAKAWATQRDEVIQQANQLAEAVTEQLAGERPAVALGEKQISRAVGSLLKSHDATLGGFGGAPKFPQPCYLRFLLAFRPYAGDDDTGKAVDAAIRVTLDHMACGGMFDQIGGGFHRYSTDEKWLVPHFEKMLYDNGQLAGVYADAARLYNNPFYALIARRICEYVLKEMTSPGGAFYSAQDAEVNHREGQNYLWTLAELGTLLSKEDAAWTAKVYGLSSGPNFRDPHHPNEPMSSVLFLAQPPDLTSRLMGMTPEGFAERLSRVNAILYAARAKRDQPIRDDKILAAWNGLMIGGLASCGASLNEPRFIEAALRAANFVLFSMREPAPPDGQHPGGLLRSCTIVNGTPKATIPAFLEDYACLIHGLVELDRAGVDGNGDCLRHAMRLADEAETRFGDESGAYFDTLADQTDLFVRTRSEYDGAIPSASSIMLNNLLDLYDIVGQRQYAVRAGRLLTCLSAFVDAAPVGAINSARGLLRFLVMDPAVQAEVMPGLNGDGVNAGSHPDAAAAVHQPVAVFAAVDDVDIAEGEPSGVVLMLKIDDGYHVNAAEPGLSDLIGLRVSIINGTGVSVYADYPAGELYQPTWTAPDSPAIRVYKGEISIPVMLERSGKWSSTPLLAVTYQACTDQVCLAPQTVELDVAINRK